MDIKEQLIKHEGLMLKPYTDSVGKLTIGVGHNLDDLGITRDVAMYILSNDIQIVIEQCEKFSWFPLLSYTRQKVIIDMVFNLGINRFKKFKRTIQYLENSNYELAAAEMLNSKWAIQVGRRAETLARMMKFNTENN